MPSPTRTAALLVLTAVAASEAFDRWVRRTGRAASRPAGRPVAVVVLGFPGHRSWARAIQRWRVEMGVRALAQHPGSTLLLTGGRTRGPVSEAAEMAEIARSLGVADDRMVLEERSRTTWENVAFARELVTPGSLVVLVSDGVHVHRARWWWIRHHHPERARPTPPPADPARDVTQLRRGAQRAADVVADRIVGRVAPAEAERVAGRVGVDLVAFVGTEVGGRLQERGAQCHCLRVCCGEVVDVEVEVHLLRVAVGPLGWDVIRGELHAHHPTVVGVDDVVPVVLGQHPAADHRGPERALGREVGRIEHDHLSHDSHGGSVAPIPDALRPCRGFIAIAATMTPNQNEKVVAYMCLRC